LLFLIPFFVFSSFLEEYKKRAINEARIPNVIDITVADNAVFIRLEDIFKRFRWKRTPRNRRGGDDNTEGGRRADDSATERRELLDFYATMINEYERRTNSVCTAQVVAEIARRIRAIVFCNLSNIYHHGTTAASVLQVMSFEGKYVRS
jgi:hypothetical protein